LLGLLGLGALVLLGLGALFDVPKAKCFAITKVAPGLYEAFNLASNLSDGIDYVIRPK